MWIGRRQDGSIYGNWPNKQPNDADHPGMEEVADNHPDLVAFLAPKPPSADQVKLATDTATVKGIAAILAFLEMSPAEIDNYVDTNFPGAAAPMPNLRVVLKVLGKVAAVTARAQMKQQ